MLQSDCPFCNPDPDRVFLQADLIVGVWDAFPVAAGHALLVTRRHVASWFDATGQERQALTEAIDSARRAILQRNAPDGFNIGVNVGEVAGQTISHLHVHVIPRYRGDVPDPRGGIRHVIPGRGNYLPEPQRGADSGRYLITGGDDPLLPHIITQLATADRADIVVSFALLSGVDRVFEHFRDLLDRGGQLRILTGDYLGITEPNALMRLIDLEGNIERRVFETASVHDMSDIRPDTVTVRSFHPKAYIFGHARDGEAFIGSSNLSASALTSAVEWNYRVISSRDGAGFADSVAAFNALFRHPCTKNLTADWVERYRERRPVQGSIVEAADVAPEAAKLPITPSIVQRAALDALEQTREAGNKAGLVVLATGLGKTWLSALDTNRPEYRRVLFVAHREEILNQALNTFRCVRPEARLGHYSGGAKDPNADVVLASIQTLSRREHLERFSPDAFDYIIVDEFHHAAAASYRKLIAYFQPKFLLGLTATPERSDGGDLLALCQQNLVYRCDLVEGVRKQLLAPFHYYGVPDDVDYANIPWRSTRFDEEALTAAVATQRRAENALEQFRTKGGRRALGFCVSQRHADFMTAVFKDRGIRAVAVHSGPTSAPRAASLEQLEAGDLDIVFAVDMFNEGVDLPTLDTVMMLRPTESKILWLQQFGRGLRTAPGKERLVVIDYIGNHRVFLLKPQTLFGLRSGDREIFNLLERLRNGTQELPPGCDVTYELEAVEILCSLLRRTTTQDDALDRYYRDFKTLHGIRPTATEVYEDGYNPRAVRKRTGSWTGFVDSMGDLDATEQRAFKKHEAFVNALDTTEMVKSYKMLVLLAMLNADRFPGSIGIDELANQVAQLATRTTRASADIGSALNDRKALIRMLEQNPLEAWTGGKGTAGVSYFSYRDQVFQTTFSVEADTPPALQELVRELAEWRLTEYLDRAHAQTAGFSTLKVSQSNGSPMLFLPPEPQRSDLPEGWTDVSVDDAAYSANFVKVAVNVVRESGNEYNHLPQILRRWFGPDAGAPGTRHAVALERKDNGWHLMPLGRRSGELQLWQSYSRKEIPPLFGFEFSTAIWNAGFVKRPGHIFLLVTLDKSAHGSEFQYKDHFISRSEFEWQSQNRTGQDSGDGRDIRHHVERGFAVHLFVRGQKRMPGGAAPFIYCGDVQFLEWHGDRPITVRWKLPTDVPDSVWASLGGTD
jgi:superfamily II DNA or RNA helicase/HKD family nuclease/diadenosine tetraphosphate (Ap4A) HIT family hydrolase